MQGEGPPISQSSREESLHSGSFISIEQECSSSKISEKIDMKMFEAEGCRNRMDNSRINSCPAQQRIRIGSLGLPKPNKQFDLKKITVRCGSPDFNVPRSLTKLSSESSLSGSIDNYLHFQSQQKSSHYQESSPNTSRKKI